MRSICNKQAPPFGKRARSCGLLMLLALIGPQAGCKGRTPKAVHVPDMAQGFAGGAIDGAGLAQDAAARRHVLNMGLPELLFRLQSFALRTQTTITLSQDNKPISQKVHTSVFVQDSAGNSHLQTGNAEHQLELLTFGDKAYVRQDRGHLRRKRRQEVDEVPMAEAAVANVRQTLQHFAGVALAHPEPIRFDGRDAVRYEVEETGQQLGGALPEPSLALLPVAAPSRWREEAKHAHLSGRMVVDTATGVVLKAELSGSMTVTGATGQPILMALSCTHTVNNIGSVSAVKEPKDSIAEIRRPVRPRNPLAFFKQAQKGQEQGATGKSGALKGQDTGAAAADDPEDGDGLPPSEELPQE